jgi:high-affinity iron transporter
VFRGGARLSLRRFFAVTSVLLLFISAGLFSAGVGKQQSLGWLPGGDPLWDTSSLLSDESVAGSFPAGLVGYRARPSALEVAAYAIYLVVTAVLFFGRLTPPTRPPQTSGKPLSRRESSGVLTPS